MTITTAAITTRRHRRRTTRTRRRRRRTTRTNRRRRRLRGRRTSAKARGAATGPAATASTTATDTTTNPAATTGPATATSAAPSSPARRIYVDIAVRRTMCVYDCIRNTSSIVVLLIALFVVINKLRHACQRVYAVPTCVCTYVYGLLGHECELFPKATCTMRQSMAYNIVIT
ncbi:uncharacterized protein [Oryza sativa Japonica Group]|uniref:cDNA clone:002-154-H05, full insert sequence n=1 Tax=Oryza sativa subsp. japonica TaxID=39947 RepID=B7F1V0_ORYSJ|nr:unnamed protein product [Oryza sativa Japonica Group]